MSVTTCWTQDGSIPATLNMLMLLCCDMQIGVRECCYFIFTLYHTLSELGEMKHSKNIACI